ncbi:MAG: hypothetical protein L0Y44_15555 [Phycisphaerales bacterium]|nr:hypothetical protein [Phycisphaerales bacterium]
MNTFRTVSIFALLLLALALAFGGGATGAAHDSASVAPTALVTMPAPAAPVSVTMFDPPSPYDTYERLLELLDLFYELLGQIFPDEEPSAAAVNAGLAEVSEAFVEFGFLPNLTQQQKTAGLDALDEIGEILSDEIEGLDPEIVADFVALIPDMRDALD